MLLLLAFLLISWVFDSFQELNTIKVKPGQNVLLQCHAPKHAIITLLQWVRPDLDSEGYVFFYRDRHLYDNYQHPSFVNRVELRDPGMKDGDVSVMLKNVNTTDTGTYQCYVSVSKPSRHKRASPDFSKTIELVVEDLGYVESPHAGQTAGLSRDGGDMRGHAALILPFAGVIVVGVWVFLKYKRQVPKHLTPSSNYSLIVVEGFISSSPGTSDELHKEQFKDQKQPKVT
ncbi:Coxsackievirus and adenovirus receptor -like protein [Channa argus]|uniref:Coxsackievirus and adenovirus receptor-like protein n=1 Tax=Channa argus TaxID=215402 RepID=A0A6G1Q7G2_CHAAH|nr:Coxsackievirus and adenovirus receptor -like protein [Channa argus]